MADSELIVSTSVLEAVVDEAMEHDRYAIDTEFHRERTYYAQVALVQLGYGDRVALIDGLHCDLSPLSALFESSSTAVIHAGRQDLEIFDRSIGMCPKRLIDTQIVASFVGYSTASLASLLDREMNISLPKGDRLTDWMKRPLSTRQLEYAANDVAHLVELSRRLDVQIDQMNRRAWVDDALKECLREPRTPRKPDEAWVKIKEVRQLKGQSLAIAQALAEWREVRAQQRDVPVRHIMSDLAIAAIASARPTNAESLSKLRGVDGGALRHVTGEILTIVATTKTDDMRTAPDLMVREVERELKPVIALVTAWCAQASRSLKIDPAILATRADIEGFLRGDSENRLRTSWRYEVLGSQLDALMLGQTAVRFERGVGLELVDLSHHAAD